MPLNIKGSRIMRNMRSQYGPKKAKRVFYSSKNAGKIKGVEGLKIGMKAGKVGIDKSKERVKRRMNKIAERKFFGGRYSV